jgi:hypothetical protein
MAEWAHLIGALAMIGIILTALSLILGIVNRSDAMQYIGAICGIVIVLLLLPGVLIGLLSAISAWQWIGLVAVGFAVLLWKQSARQSRKRRKE